MLKYNARGDQLPPPCNNIPTLEKYQYYVTVVSADPTMGYT